MGSLRRMPVVFAVVAAALATAANASAAGPIQSGLGNPSVKTLRTGVTLSTYRVSVLDSGVLRNQTIYKVAWTIGNPHVQLNATPLGTYYTDDTAIRLNRISSWWSGSALGSTVVAAVNGDFFADSRRHSSAGVPSGLLVHARTIYHFGWGGPSVGYRPDGGLVMGRPRARATVLSLPGGKTATVGSFNSLATNGVAIHGDQVAAYVNAGARVTVPTGYVGFDLPSTVLRSTLRGSKGGLSFSTGAGVKETVAAFRFGAGGPTPSVSMPTAKPAACPTGTCPAGTQLTVGVADVVLIGKAGGVAATGLSARASAGGAVSVTVDDAGWATVTDVMGGKPQLVHNGQPIYQRPSYVDPWQWDYPHWRPAIVKASNGQAWMIVAGGNNGVGIQATTWARMLAQMGAKDAMGFDNNSSTELFRPGVAPITAYGYERYIPSATYLSYR